MSFTFIIIIILKVLTKHLRVNTARCMKKKKNEKNNNNNYLTVLSTYGINGRRLENGSGRRTDI